MAKTGKKPAPRKPRKLVVNPESAPGKLVDIEVHDADVVKPSKGVGDTVEKVLEKTGVAKVAKKILGDDCGCKERKEWLNKAFPYVMLKKGTMNDEQVEAWKAFKAEKHKSLNVELQEWVISLYNSIFQTNLQPCIGCGNGKVWSNYINRIDAIYNDILIA